MVGRVGHKTSFFHEEYSSLGLKTILGYSELRHSKVPELRDFSFLFDSKGCLLASHGAERRVHWVDGLSILTLL